MFGIGTYELLLICVVALVVLGPRRLPEIAYKIGKTLGSLKRMSAEFQRNLNIEVATLEEREEKKKQDYYNNLELPCTSFNGTEEGRVEQRAEVDLVPMYDNTVLQERIKEDVVTHDSVASSASVLQNKE